MQNFLKKKHFLPPDTHMCVSEVELRHHANIESEASTPAQIHILLIPLAFYKLSFIKENQSLTCF